MDMIVATCSLLGFSLNSLLRDLVGYDHFLKLFFFWLRMQVNIKLLLIIVYSLYVWHFTLFSGS
jgi:hypothetical protein